MEMERQGDGATFRLPSRFEGAAVASLKSQALTILSEDNIKHIVLDFGGVSYMDSMALGALLLLRERSMARSKTLTLADLQPKVRSLLALANVQKLFEIR